jgi:hypothetical protein
MQLTQKDHIAMERGILKTSPLRFIIYFTSANVSIMLFTLYRAHLGAWFVNGLLFAISDIIAFLIFTIIMISYYKLGSEVWKVRRFIREYIPKFLSILISSALTLFALYAVTEISMIFSLYTARVLGFDPLTGYVP